MTDDQASILKAYRSVYRLRVLADGSVTATLDARLSALRELMTAETATKASQYERQYRNGQRRKG